MSIIEKYREYQALYSQYVEVVKNGEKYRSKDEQLKNYKKEIYFNLMDNKKKGWAELQRKKHNVQIKLDVLEGRFGLEDDYEKIEDDEIFNVDIAPNDCDDTWWEGLDHNAISKYIEIDACHAQLQKMELQENVFEQTYEKLLQKKYDLIDSYMERDTGELEKLHQQMQKKYDEIKEARTLLRMNDVGGRLSKSFYVVKKVEEGEVPSVCEIKHEQAPILFLYKEFEEDIDVIYDFMDHIVQQIIETNCIKLFDIYISLYGMNISERQMLRRMQVKTPISNIYFKSVFKEFTEAVNCIIDNNFAKCKNSDINDFNGKLLREYGETTTDFLKCVFSQIYIPTELRTSGVNLDSDFFGAMEDGRRYGFVPIIYVSEKEWKDENTENVAIKILREKMSKLHHVEYLLDFDTWDATDINLQY